MSELRDMAEVIMAEEERPVRLGLRLSFREWSKAVDSDGLASARAWLRTVEVAVSRAMGWP